MLAVCAPTFNWRLANHCRVFTYKGKIYRSFPKQDKIELGHIRSLARHFGILDCAKEEILGL